MTPTMTPTTITIESVHGIKQTVVLVPSSESDSRTKSAIGPATDDQNLQDDRLRSSK